MRPFSWWSRRRDANDRLRRQVDVWRAEAAECQRRGEYAAASTLLESVVATRWAGFWDHHERVTAALYGGDLARAELLLAKLPPAPASSGAIAMLQASLAERKGNHAEALHKWIDAREAGGAAYWCRYGEARALARLGRVREAQRAMCAALAEADADEGGWHYALGLDLQLGDEAAAEAKFTRLELDADARERARLFAIPGMTWNAEREAMRSAARELTLQGDVVDLGCFLGSLTAALASGLRANPHSPRRAVHAIDSFVWYDDYMGSSWSDVFPAPAPIDGGSFRHGFAHWMSRWQDQIVVHTGDLLTFAWHDPIALLCIDAMKSPELTRAILEHFATHVVAGALVMQQDFCFAQTWWIHVYHYLLREHFSVADQLAGASGVIFRLDTPIAPTTLQHVLQQDITDPSLADEAFAFSRALVAPIDRAIIDAAHRRFYEDVQPLGWERRVHDLLAASE